MGLHIHLSHISCRMKNNGVLPNAEIEQRNWSYYFKRTITFNRNEIIN